MTEGYGYQGTGIGPSGGPPGGGGRPPGRGCGGGGGDGYDPEDGDKEEDEDDATSSSSENLREVSSWRLDQWIRRMTGAPGGGRPPDEPDPDYDNPYDWLRGPRGHCGHGGQAGWEGPPGPPGPPGPQGPATPFSSTGMGDLPSLNLSTTTVGVENSLRYMRDSMNRLLEAQRCVNQTMAAHMNASTAAKETQSVALAQLVENTHQREFDKMFNTIPIYDGEDLDKFEPWLEQLQNACRVGKCDIWAVAMCCTSRPVLEVLQSMDPSLGWSKICNELQRCFSPNRKLGVKLKCVL